jgi:iron-sulfur cluster repair protein YtfE (RIC family)
VTLTSSVITGNQWYNNGVLVSGATSQTYTASAGGTYTCTVTSNGCTSAISNSIVVTVNPIPSAPVISASSATTFCSGGSVILNSSTISGNQWYKDGVVISGATSQTYTATTSGTYTSKVTTNSCTSVASNAIIIIVNAIPTAPTITAGSGTTFCSGGSVILTSSSSTGNQWYNNGVLISGATNQTYTVSPSGTYTCTVTSSGCTSIASNSIVVMVNPIPLAPVITASDVTTFCSGGSVTLSSSIVSGNQWYKDDVLIPGATSQTYLVNTSGTYTSKVTTTGCTSVASNGIVVTVNPVPAAPTITAGSATSFCSGGSVIISSSSATGNQWYKDGIIISGATAQTYTANTSGNYTSKVTTTGCTSLASNTITVTVTAIPSAPVISTESLTTICSGNSTLLLSSVASGNQWYKDAVTITGENASSYAAIANGSYTAKVTVSGCTSVASNAINITVNPTPAKPTITLVGNSLQSSAASGNQWYKEGVLISGATNQLYSPAANGNYTVIVTVNGCSGPVSDAFNFLSTAIPDISFSEKIKIYPNPVLTDLLIVSKTSAVQQTIKLFDVNGKQLLLISNNSPSLKINMEQFASGLYLLWIEDRKNKITGKLKILKQ